MPLLHTLLALAGAVALLLWGVHMVQTGVQRAFGARLRAFLGRALRDRGRAFLAGIGVTALLQSSTATGLMVTGFAAGGLVELAPGLSVMLGANVGTTLIVQALSFDVFALSPLLVLAGVLTFRRASAGVRDFGRVLIGLGLLLLALRQFVDLLQPYADAPALRAGLRQVAGMPFLAVAIAAAITWAAHSSVAVVLLAMSFAAHGVIAPDAAFAIVLGANLGTAVNPVLEGGAADPVARRLPIGNLLNRLAGVGAAGLALPWLAPALSRLDPGPGRVVADFHTGFNLAMAAISFPLLPAMAALLRRLLPARVDLADPALPIYLDPAAREAPVVALGAAARESLRLADILDTMLAALRDALLRADRRQIDAIRRLDDTLDRLHDTIKAYVTALEPDALSAADFARMDEVLAFATNLEHAGDVVECNLLHHAAKLHKRGLGFSDAGREALGTALDRAQANVRAAAALFVTEDIRAARLLAAEKAAFREMERDATDAHLRQLREGASQDGQGGAGGGAGALHLDVLRDLKRLNTHLVAAAAYPVLRRKGELLPSRLRLDDEIA